MRLHTVLIPIQYSKPDTYGEPCCPLYLAKFQQGKKIVHLESQGFGWDQSLKLNFGFSFDSLGTIMISAKFAGSIISLLFSRFQPKQSRKNSKNRKKEKMK